MTTAPAPLSLPTDGWEGWLAARVRRPARRGPAAGRRCSSGGPHDSAAAMALWNDLNLALHNAFATRVAAVQRAPRGGGPDPRRAGRAGRPQAADRDRPRPRALRRAGRRGPAGRSTRAAGGCTPWRSATSTGPASTRTSRCGRGCGSSPSGRPPSAQEFSKNIRDEVRSVAGRARGPRRAARGLRRGHPAGEDGLVEITTAYPDYVPFMTFCRDRDARAALVREFLNRA